MAYLKLAILVCLVGSGTVVWSAEASINIKDWGAVGDGVTDDSGALIAAVNGNAGATIRFPAADYLLDNSKGPIMLSGFGGTLSFDPGARLLCVAPARGCLTLSGGTGARIYNLRIGYQTAPTRRTSEYGLYLLRTTDTIVDGAVIENSPSAAILSEDAVRPMLSHINVITSLADGIHFANCQDPKLSDAVTNDTGDDGVAFVNYQAGDDNSGGQAVNVTVRNSHSRGITVAGQSDVLVSNFLVDTTSSSGILVLTDTSFNTRTPSRVRFQNGIIKKAGTLAPSGGNLFGIECSGAASCAFSNISVYDSASRSVSGWNPNGEIYLANIQAYGGGSGFNISSTPLVILSNLTAVGSASYGFFIATSGTIVAHDLRTENVATGSSLNRAIWFENDSDVRAHALTVVDTQAVPTGYIVGEANNQTVVLTGLQSVISNGKLVIQSHSQHATIVREDPK